MRLPCGCCRGVEKLTPAEIFNRPGLPALTYRLGTHATLFETMQASLAGWPLTLPGPDASAPQTTIYPLGDLTTRDTSDPSIALLDAWAMGTPVVSTSLGCAGLKAADGENILIRDDPQGFAQAVQEVVTHDDLRRRLAANGRRTAEQIYGWDIIGQDLRTEYRRLMERPPA